MNSKKKLIISLSSFVVVLLAAVIAVVAVLAATNANVKSGVTVNFKVLDPAVVADVDTSYIIGNGVSEPVGDTIRIDGSEQENYEQVLEDLTFELNSENNFVIISFDISEYVEGFDGDSFSWGLTTSLDVTLEGEDKDYFTVYTSTEGGDFEKSTRAAVDIDGAANFSVKIVVDEGAPSCEVTCSIDISMISYRFPG